MEKKEEKNTLTNAVERSEAVEEQPITAGLLLNHRSSMLTLIPVGLANPDPDPDSDPDPFMLAPVYSDSRWRTFGERPWITITLIGQSTCSGEKTETVSKVSESSCQWAEPEVSAQSKAH